MDEHLKPIVVNVSEKTWIHMLTEAAQEEPPPHIMSHHDYFQYVANK